MPDRAKSAVEAFAGSILSTDDPAVAYGNAATTFAALGFDGFLLTTAADSVAASMAAPAMMKWRPGARETYVQEGHVGRDFILSLFRAHPTGVAWRGDQPVHDSEHRRFLDYCAAFGARSGIVAPVLTAGNKVRIVSATIDVLESFDLSVFSGVVMVANLIALSEARRPGPERDAVRITPYQYEILAWAAQGKSNAVIAAIMNASVRTISYHMSEILRKLDVSSRGQAIALLAMQKVIPDV